MQKIFGLPAHPLMVHLPIVLIPVVSIAAMLLAMRREWRGRFGLALIAASAVSCVAIFVAKQSGEELFALMNQAPDIAHHESLADTTLMFTLALFVSIVAMVFFHRRGTAKKRSRLAVGLSAVTIVLAVLATVGTIQTGHEGAKLSWQKVASGG